MYPFIVCVFYLSFVAFDCAQATERWLSVAETTVPFGYAQATERWLSVAETTVPFGYAQATERWLSVAETTEAETTTVISPSSHFVASTVSAIVLRFLM